MLPLCPAGVQRAQTLRKCWLPTGGPNGDLPYHYSVSDEVTRMFARIAPRYDLANDVLSLGLHRAWRRALVRRSELRPGQSALDCATGTGDLALLLKRRVGFEGQVTGIDACAPMLALARRKAERARLAVYFQLADMERLPFRDGAFDVATVAFGVRNLGDPLAGLREMGRVVRPGGRVLVLEFGRPEGFFGRLFDWYSRRLIPPLGGLITGNRQAYEYLQRTSAAFPCGEEFLALMRLAGCFSTASFTALCGGIAFLYVGDTVQ